MKRYNLIPADILEAEYANTFDSMTKVAERLGVDRRHLKYSLVMQGLHLRAQKSYNKVDIADRRFGRLVAIRQVDNPRSSSAKWLCRCDCGGTKEAWRTSLVSGLTQSCGCRFRDSLYKGYEGLSGCYWSRVLRGATKRGLAVDITIEDAWLLFLSQDRKCALSGMEIGLVTDLTRHRDKHTASLDRIDNSKGYVKGNVQWVHRDVNIIRRTLPVSRFVEICEMVSFRANVGGAQGAP